LSRLSWWVTSHSHSLLTPPMLMLDRWEDHYRLLPHFLRSINRSRTCSVLLAVSVFSLAALHCTAARAGAAAAPLLHSPALPFPAALPCQRLPPPAVEGDGASIPSGDTPVSLPPAPQKSTYNCSPNHLLFLFLPFPFPFPS